MGRSNTPRAPAKYSSSWRRTSSSRAGASSTRGDTRTARSSRMLVLAVEGDADEAASVDASSERPDRRVGGGPGHVDEALGHRGGAHPVGHRDRWAGPVPGQPGDERIGGHGSDSLSRLVRREARPARTFCRAAASLHPMIVGDLGVGGSSRYRWTRRRAASWAAGDRRPQRPRRPAVGGRATAGSGARRRRPRGRRATRRWWSITLWWAIVNSQPRRLSARRSDGVGPQRASTVSWKQSAPSCAPSDATRKRCTVGAVLVEERLEGRERTARCNAGTRPGVRSGATYSASAFEQLGRRVLRADLRPRLADPALLVDQEGRADDPHVLACRTCLLAPRPVGLGHGVVLSDSRAKPSPYFSSNFVCLAGLSGLMPSTVGVADVAERCRAARTPGWCTPACRPSDRSTRAPCGP